MRCRGGGPRLTNGGRAIMKANPAADGPAMNKGQECLNMNARELAATIDHTLFKPDATRAEVRKLCDEAKAYGFASVCVNPSRIALAAAELRGTDVAPCCVVGFPSAPSPAESKAAETAVAVKNGAREVDMVIDIGAAKDGDWALVERDIAAVKAACGDAAKLKVIIETCLLTDEEKVQACLAAKRAARTS